MAEVSTVLSSDDILILEAIEPTESVPSTGGVTINLSPKALSLY